MALTDEWTLDLSFRLGQSPATGVGPERHPACNHVERSYGALSPLTNCDRDQGLLVKTLPAEMLQRYGAGGDFEGH